MEENNQIGNTPLKRYTFKNTTFFVKHEEYNPNGSFKDRSLSYQLNHYIDLNKTHFVISSSGNAAVSAANYISKVPNATLDVFVSINIDTIKLQKLQKFASANIQIHQVKKPKSDAIKYAHLNAFINLRGSKDDLAIIGYKDISTEIYTTVPTCDAIFIPCSSGTSTVGIHQAFKDLGINPAIHICQNTKIHPIAKAFDTDFTKEETHLASAIADRIAHRKNEVVNAINSSDGFGWVISNKEILDAKEIAKELFDNEVSYNSLLSLAGFLKALDKGYQYDNPILLFSGL